MHMKYTSLGSPHSPSLLRRAAAIVPAAALAGVALMFSAVLLAGILVVGAFAAAYLWWKTRELRKGMRNFPPRGAAREHDQFQGDVFKGEVIEGEVVRIHDARDDVRR